MKRCFMTLSTVLTLFMLSALYCMEQDENAKKLALFFEIKPVYQKGQPEYESFRNREYDIYEPRPALSRDEIVIAAARAKTSTPGNSASKTLEQTVDGNKTKTETK